MINQRNHKEFDYHESQNFIVAKLLDVTCGEAADHYIYEDKRLSLLSAYDYMADLYI